MKHLASRSAIGIAPGIVPEGSPPAACQSKVHVSRATTGPLDNPAEHQAFGRPP